MLLENKVVIVTGASSGIGQQSAYALAREGASIVAADVNLKGGEETTQQILENGGKALFIQADITRADEVESIVKAALDHFGRLDCAVNNAGISGDHQVRIHEYDDEWFDRVIAVNLKGVWLCMKAELKVMMMQGRGVIVNVASVAGLIGSPKGAAYSASKHGVVGLTRSAAVEYAKLGIRVNAVCPAYTDTPMVSNMVETNLALERLTLSGIPMKRLGRPEEIAEGVVWLCSEASSFVTGHALTLDGGLTAI